MKKSQNNASVLVISGNLVLADLLKQGISKSNHLVTVVNDLAGAVNLLTESNDFALILFDTDLPADELELALQQINKVKQQASLIILANFTNPQLKVTCLQAGADDYLSKPFVFEELLARVGVQIRRSKSVPKVNLNKLIQVGEISFDLKQQVAKMNGEMISFSPQEFKIASFLAQNQGEICSAKAIWQATHDDPESIPNTSTINVHMMRIRRKLGDNYQIVSLKKRGFVFTVKK